MARLLQAARREDNSDLELASHRYREAARAPLLARAVERRRADEAVRRSGPPGAKGAKYPTVSRAAHSPFTQEETRALWASLVGVLRAYITVHHERDHWSEQFRRTFNTSAHKAEGSISLHPHDVPRVFEFIQSVLARQQRSRTFPVEVAARLADTLEELLTGRMPAPFEILGRAKKSTYGPGEVSCIVAAVRYVNAAISGPIMKYIDDSTPVKTVCKLFEIVEDPTWGDWRTRIRGAAELRAATDVEHWITLQLQFDGPDLAQLAQQLRDELHAFADAYKVLRRYGPGR